jgi:hypothetical protein
VLSVVDDRLQHNRAKELGYASDKMRKTLWFEALSLFVAGEAVWKVVLELVRLGVASRNIS